MQAFPGAKSRTIWVTDNVPAKDNNDEYVGLANALYPALITRMSLLFLRTEGASRPITGDFGVVSRGGTYCGVTELAPGVVTSWVS